MLIKIINLILFFTVTDAGDPNPRFTGFDRLTKEDNNLLRDYCGKLGNENLVKESNFKVNPGTRAAKDQFLWTVLLKMHKMDEDIGELYVGACTAILISRKHILTSAHCLFDSYKVPNDKGGYNKIYTNAKPTNIRAYIGAKAKEESGKHVVSKKFWSEARDSDDIKFNGFDWALLQLKTAVEEDDIKQGIVVPICFTHRHTAFPDQQTTMAGYGDDREGGFKGLNYGTATDATCPQPNPFMRCYSRLNEMGDSGSAYFKYDSNHRAHLTAICKGTEPDGSVDNAVDAEIDIDGGPFRFVTDFIGFDYATW